MFSLLQKMKGNGGDLPPKPTVGSALLAGFGGTCAIAALALTADNLQLALVLGSFGASCVLIFGFPDAPFSQPRNVILGHTLSSLIGLLCLALFGPNWWSVALAVGTAITLMMLTRTVHPPAGSNPVIVYLTEPSWHFLFFPTFVGSAVLVIIALFYNNTTSTSSHYPKYW